MTNLACGYCCGFDWIYISRRNDLEGIERIMNRHWIFGGFLAGKRTYILATLAFVTEMVNWAVGDATLGTLIDHAPTLFQDLAMATLRAGFASGMANAYIVHKMASFK